MPAKMYEIAAPASYPTLPQIDLPFEPDTLVMHADSGIYMVSFDGLEDHLMIHTAHGNLVIPTKRRKLWIKQSGGAATARIAAITLR